MHEVSVRGRLLVAPPEQCDLVSHAAIAKPSNLDASVDCVRKAEFFSKLALRFYDHADDRRLLGFQPAFADQKVRNRSGELGIVDDIVDVAIGV